MQREHERHGGQGSHYELRGSRGLEAAQKKAAEAAAEPVAVDAAERRSTRKRGAASQAEETLSTASAPVTHAPSRSRHAAAAEPASTAVPAPAEAVKRRRR